MGQNKGHKKWYFGIPRTEFGKKYFEHTGLHMVDDKPRYDEERRFYLKNGYCSWEKEA